MAQAPSLFELEALKIALSKALGKPVNHATYTLDMLQGGTVANVQLVSGTAATAGGEVVAYKIVLKTQHKWDRYRDPFSWRREYDLYKSNLPHFFADDFRWPHCYLAQMNQAQDQTQLWLEYIDGATGKDLNQSMLEKAAYALGSFQGKVYGAYDQVASELTNTSDQDYARNFYDHYRSWPVVYDFIRSDQTELPQHLCQMLIDFDEVSPQFFEAIKGLPKVFCHRDYWIANVFYTKDSIQAIDWDTAGWGYLGEDIASFIADEADNDHMVAYYHGLVSAYLKGFSDQTGIGVEKHYIFERILALFGYRLVEWFIYAPSEERKAVHQRTLENLYVIMQLNKRCE